MRSVNEQFLKLVEIAKTMKCNMYQFQRDCIVGTDEQLASVSLIYVEEELTSELYKNGLCGIMFKATDISSIFKASENINPGDPLAAYLDEFEFTHFGVAYESDYIVRNLIKEAAKMQETLGRLFERLAKWPVSFSCNLRDPEYNRFFEILSLKKDDGADFVVFGDKGQYKITVFPGIIPVTQKDKVQLNIMDLGPDYPYFLTEFNIFRKVPKTKVELHIRKYILYMKLPL